MDVAIVILFMITGVHNGSVITTQEFKSMTQCQYVASILQKERYVRQSWCVYK